MINDKRIIAIVQGTTDDLYDSRDPDDYCITTLKNSDLFDDIIIAAPEQESQEIFRQLADTWGVSVYFGSVYNVADRFYQVAKKYNADIIVRVQLRAFYIDIDIVIILINALGTEHDYVDVDNNTNYALGSDVFTTCALGKVIEIVDGMPESHEKDTILFSPWALLNNKKLFNVNQITYRERWDKDRVRRIKNKLARLFAGSENKSAVSIDNPASRYNYVCQFINPDDIVLDIACGHGGGTARVAENCKEIYGIDSNTDYIENAKRNYNKGNLHFHYGTQELLKSMRIKFDKIISLHTLEHVDNDKYFLLTLRSSLANNGKLILEVPRLLKYPLGEPLFPFHKIEYERNSLRQLLCDTGFTIEVEKGMNRNLYVKIEEAREVLFYVCKKRP